MQGTFWGMSITRGAEGIIAELSKGCESLDDYTLFDMMKAWYDRGSKVICQINETVIHFHDTDDWAEPNI